MASPVLLSAGNEWLLFDIRTTSPGGYAVLSRRDFFLLQMYFPHFPCEFISSVLEHILQSNPDAFCHNTGAGGRSNAPVSANDVYQAVITGLCL